jgi:hypothetical protein
MKNSDEVRKTRTEYNELTIGMWSPNTGGHPIHGH